MSLLRLIEPTGGTVKYNGTDITRISGPALRQCRRHMQMVFQDPYNSVNPRMTIGDIIAEPLRNFKAASKRKRQARVQRIIRRVGLQEGHIGKFPHQLSGGQLQRVESPEPWRSNPDWLSVTRSFRPWMYPCRPRCSTC